MGTNQSQQQDRAGKPSAPHLPRHVIEHIGQVLRNRYREDLLVPLPQEMLTVLETTSRSSSRMSSERNERDPAEVRRGAREGSTSVPFPGLVDRCR
jgi:hypothetical protein